MKLARDNVDATYIDP